MHFQAKKSELRQKLEKEFLNTTKSKQWNQRSIEALNFFLLHQEKYHRILNSNLKDPVNFRVLVPVDLDEVEVDMIWTARYYKYLLFCGFLSETGKLYHWIGEIWLGKIEFHFQIEQWLGYKMPPQPKDKRGLRFFEEKTRQRERREQDEANSSKNVKKVEKGSTSI